MTRLRFGWRSGETLTYEALQADGTVRTAAGTSLPEINSTGYYTVDDGSVVVGDVALVNDGNGIIGWGEEAPESSLADNAITASKYDETTAFPVVKTDTGSTEIARTGADNDTLKSISDEIDNLNNFDPAADTVARVTLTDTATVVTTKTGYALASDGLDTVSITEPAGVASNFREMVVQTWRRLFKKSKMTTTEIVMYKDDGSTAATTQVLSETATEQNMGAAS